jgi:hypothetical protein
MARAQRRARSRYSTSPVRCPRHSMNRVMAGMATPKLAMMMCQPSDSAIWVRAAAKSPGVAASARIDGDSRISTTRAP